MRAVETSLSEFPPEPHTGMDQSPKLPAKALKYLEILETKYRPSELEIRTAYLIAAGFPLKAISGKLGVGEHAVQSARKSLYEGFDIDTQIEIANLFPAAEAQPRLFDEFTRTEREVLHFISRGLTPNEVGKLYGLSSHMIKEHLKQVRIKTKVHATDVIVSILAATVPEDLRRRFIEDGIKSVVAPEIPVVPIGREQAELFSSTTNSAPSIGPS